MDFNKEAEGSGPRISLRPRTPTKRFRNSARGRPARPCRVREDGFRVAFGALAVHTAPLRVRVWRSLHPEGCVPGEFHAGVASSAPNSTPAPPPRADAGAPRGSAGVGWGWGPGGPDSSSRFPYAHPNPSGWRLLRKRSRIRLAGHPRASRGHPAPTSARRMPPSSYARVGALP